MPFGNQAGIDQVIHQLAGFDLSTGRQFRKPAQFALQLIFSDDAATFQQFEKAFGAGFRHLFQSLKKQASHWTGKIRLLGL
jgi:hypothetical protein